MASKNQFLRPLWLESFSVIQKMFCRLISISTRFVFLQLCVLMLIASCAVEGLGLVFLSRSSVLVDFLVSRFSLPPQLRTQTFPSLHKSHIFTPLQNLRAAELSKNLETGQQKYKNLSNACFLLMLIDVLACVRFLSDTKLDNFCCI